MLTEADKEQDQVGQASLLSQADQNDKNDGNDDGDVVSQNTNSIQPQNVDAVEFYPIPLPIGDDDDDDDDDCMDSENSEVVETDKNGENLNTSATLQSAETKQHQRQQQQPKKIKRNDSKNNGPLPLLEHAIQDCFQLAISAHDATSVDTIEKSVWHWDEQCDDADDDDANNAATLTAAIPVVDWNKEQEALRSWIPKPLFLPIWALHDPST